MLLSIRQQLRKQFPLNNTGMSTPVQRSLFVPCTNNYKSLRQVLENRPACTYMNVLGVFILPCSSVALTPDKKVQYCSN